MQDFLGGAPVAIAWISEAGVCTCGTPETTLGF